MPVRGDGLLILLLAYCAASLVHYFHNAAFLDEYPNMPAWLSPMGIHLAWLSITTLGIAGYLLFRLGYCFAGLAVIAVYGALGLDGLGHYTLAPLSAHSPAMNLTIWLEAVAAALVLAAAVRLMVRRLREA